MNETKDISRKQKPELLAPAGSAEALAAAVSAGADAVYFGGKLGNARLNAKNFTNAEVAENLKLLHHYGRKGYITLNTVHTDREIMKGDGESGLLTFIETALMNGADAFILQDLGLAEVIGRYFPTAVLHASTQAAAHNADAAKFLAGLGFSRVICARELSAKNLGLLIKNSPIEVEMFIHGALCSSHSGRCYFSYALGGTRSANRGACAQPCRLNYKTGGASQPTYPLSLKDLSLATHITELLQLSPCSLKIEGRMKTPEYVYTVTKIYRRLLDEERNANNKEMDVLARVFSRSGFTDGYFTEKLGSQMYGIRTEQNKAVSKEATEKSKPLLLNLPAEIKAKTEPENPGTEPFTVTLPANARYHNKKKPLLTLIFSDTAQLSQVQQLFNDPEVFKAIDKIFIPLVQLEGLLKLSLPNALKAKISVKFPLVVTDSEMQAVTKKAETARSSGLAYALVDNIGHIELARNLGFEVWGNSGLGVTNSFALNVLADTGLQGVILSHELNFAQIRDIKKTVPVSALVYGHLPLMISENCLINNAGNCKAPSGRLTCPQFSLTDRRGTQFPVLGEYGHRNVILNSVPVFWADKKEKYRNLGLSTVSLLFTTESGARIAQIIKDYALDKPVKPPAAFSRNGY